MTDDSLPIAIATKGLGRYDVLDYSIWPSRPCDIGNDIQVARCLNRALIFQHKYREFVALENALEYCSLSTIRQDRVPGVELPIQLHNPVEIIRAGLANVHDVAASPNDKTHRPRKAARAVRMHAERRFVRSGGARRRTARLTDVPAARETE